MRLSFFHSTRTIVGAAFVAGSLCGIAGTGIAATVLGSSVFDDVQKGSYYDRAIGDMYTAGIIKGYDSDTFGPNDYVTRGQIAVMLQRFRDDLQGTTPDDSEDDDTSTSSSSSSRSRSSSSSKSSSSSYSSVYNPKGALRFTSATYSVSEEKNSITITVVRTGGNEGSVTANYAVSGGTATSGTDYEAVSGTLSFGTKETSKTFSVTIKDDSSSEGNETATITLSQPGNGVSIGTPSTATLTIIDNESSGSSNSTSSTVGASSSSVNPNGTISFGALTYMVAENGGSIAITVKRNGGTSGTVNVNYATSNGTAVAGSKYAATSGTLTFASGESSKTFNVSITDDAALDGSKNFTVTLSNPTSGANIGNPSSATVTIQDNENEGAQFGTGSLKFSKSEMSASEGNGKAEITVQRVGGATGTVSVNYNTINGQAVSGSDFVATSGTLTFAPGETSKLISVPLIKDTLSESDDIFYVELTNPTANAQLISPYSITVNLFD